MICFLKQFQGGLIGATCCLILIGCSGSLRKPELYSMKLDKPYTSYRADLKKIATLSRLKTDVKINTLSRTQSLEWALQNNYSLQQAAWEIEKALAIRNHNSLWSNPEVEAETENYRESIYKLSLTLPLDISGTKWKEGQIGKINVEQAQHHYQTVRLNLVSEVKRRYSEAQSIQAILKILEEAQELSAQMVNLSKNRLAAGAGSKVDQIYATIDFERAQFRYSDMEMEYDLRKHHLSNLWAQSADHFSDVEHVQPLPEKLLDEKLLLQQIDQMPELKVLYLEKKKQEILKSSAWRDIISGFHITGTYTQDLNLQEDQWGAALGLELPVFDQKIYHSRALAIDDVMSELTIKDSTALAQQKIRRLYKKMKRYHQEVNSYQKTILPSLKMAYDESIVFYKNGKLPLIELVRLKNEWLEENITLIERVKLFYLALFELEAAFDKSWDELNEVKQ